MAIVQSVLSLIPVTVLLSCSVHTLLLVRGGIKIPDATTVHYSSTSPTQKGSKLSEKKAV